MIRVLKARIEEGIAGCPLPCRARDLGREEDDADVVNRADGWGPPVCERKRERGRGGLLLGRARGWLLGFGPVSPSLFFFVPFFSFFFSEIFSIF